MLGQFTSWWGYATSFCQSCLPARSKHSRLRTVPSLLAWVRKMRSPQMTGVPLPGWASLTFHLTFSFGPHFNGTSFSEQWPCPVGPRQAGQLSPAASAVQVNRGNSAAMRFICSPPLFLVQGLCQVFAEPFHLFLVPLQFVQ